MSIVGQNNVISADKRVREAWNSISANHPRRCLKTQKETLTPKDQLGSPFYTFRSILWWENKWMRIIRKEGIVLKREPHTKKKYKPGWASCPENQANKDKNQKKKKERERKLKKRSYLKGIFSKLWKKKPAWTCVFRKQDGQEEGRTDVGSKEALQSPNPSFSGVSTLRRTPTVSACSQ